jgi:hyperosmotically inducible protein
MKRNILVIAIASLMILACSQQQKSPDTKASVEQALTQAGLNTVSVSQDRDKGVITLSGNVQTDDEKAKAESIARSASNSMVIANQIGVRPAGFEREAKKIDSNLDAAIEKNFEAILIKKQLKDKVKYSAENGVLTIRGEVDSMGRRNEIEQLAGSVPNVKQVVNEIQISGMKATSRG